jgi:phage terminase small subunit
MGRPRKPDMIKLLEGNRGRREIGRRSARVVASGTPEIVDDLPDGAKAVMSEIIAHAPPGLFAGADTAALTAFAMAAHLHRVASEMLWRTGGPVVHGRRNPWVKILNAQSAMMARLGSGLGLNPIDRQRLIR